MVPIDYGYTFPAKIIEFFDIVTPSREDIKGYKKLLLDKTNLGKGEIESIVVCKNREYLFSSMDDKALKFAKGCGVKTISLHAILRSLLKSNIVKEEEAREIIKEIEEKDKTTILNQEAKIDKNIFKQIFRDWWSVFIVAYPNYGWTDKIIQKMLGCGDPANGFCTYICLCCGNEKKVPFSCKTTFCLSCAKAYVDNWVEQIKCTLFEGVEYKHVVLTVPESLRAYFNKKELLDELVKCGIAMLNDFFGCCTNKDIEAGYIVVLQTAGRAGIGTLIFILS